MPQVCPCHTNIACSMTGLLLSREYRWCPALPRHCHKAPSRRRNVTVAILPPSLMSSSAVWPSSSIIPCTQAEQTTVPGPPGLYYCCFNTFLLRSFQIAIPLFQPYFADFFPCLNTILLSNSLVLVLQVWAVPYICNILSEFARRPQTAQSRAAAGAKNPKCWDTTSLIYSVQTSAKKGYWNWAQQTKVDFHIKSKSKWVETVREAIQEFWGLFVHQQFWNFG